MITVTFYQMGQSPVNYQIEEGTTIAKMFECNDIHLEGGFLVTVNSKKAQVSQILKQDDTVVITRNEIKGGN